ncbi:hypothetical protein N9A28_01135 [Sulfurimonas sp.]|nr:hypothetical protein [Sulfurimonas sp.]
MDVSSSQGSGSVSAQVEVMKKATEVQERQVLKVLESANEQSQQIAAHKTGVGSHLNVSA